LVEAEETNKKEVADLKLKAAALEHECSERAEYVKCPSPPLPVSSLLSTTLDLRNETRRLLLTRYFEGLQNHRRVLCGQWEIRLLALKNKREAAVATFNADVAHLEKQFEQTRSRFDNVLTTKIEHAKAAASDAAITIQPVPDRLAYQDHGWLSFELEEQRQE
jgi:hypothetical protein